nr:hypothetical protein CPGR_04286 [Mycolicibacterium malmesburyense]
MPLPPAQLWQAPHVAGLDAAVLRQPGGDRAVDAGALWGQKARQRAGEAVAVRVEGGHRHRAVAALCRADDAVTRRRQALVGGQPVRQFVGQEGLPLLAAVELPVGVHAPRTARGRGHRDALAGEGVHRVARGDPVADVGCGVERIEQNDRVRAAALEGDGDVAAHRGRRHHQHLDLRLGRRRHRRARGPQTRGQCHGQDRPEDPLHRLAHLTSVCWSPREVVNHTPARAWSEKDQRRRPRRIAAVGCEVIAVPLSYRRRASPPRPGWRSASTAAAWHRARAGCPASSAEAADPSTPSCAYRTAGS